MRRSALRLLVLLALAWAGVARADGDVAHQRALLLLRVLSYDHNLRERAGDSVTVVLVYSARNAESRGDNAALREGLEALDKLRVAGLPFRVTSHEFVDAEQLRALVDRERPTALYLGPGLSEQVEGVSRATRAGRILSFSSSDAYARAGLSVAIVADSERARIVINLAASRAEGAAFDAGLLKLAEVLR
jgi:hypothetical protein